MEGNSEKLNLSGRRVDGVSRDLMTKKLKNEAHFTNEDQQRKQEAEKNEEKIELNLGLSMNGRFGVDPSTTKNLKRSSSVTNLAETHPRGAARGDHAPLSRASSLPAETEEWRRPGKELDSATAARRKRMEKMKSVRVVREKGIYRSGDVVEHGGSELHEDEKGGVNVQFLENGGVVNGSENWMGKQSSQGSIGSQRGSAAIHVPQGQVMMGANQNTMKRSSSSRQILNEHGFERPAAVGAAARNRVEKQRLLKNALLDMPHVSTRGYGPNRVEGILYRYGRADELKIVCACHGLFLSPAEFVRHGGGGDVAQPLKHIVVNPFPLFQV